MNGRLKDRKIRYKYRENAGENTDIKTKKIDTGLFEKLLFFVYV
jgi:hypothetical protein